jgi:peptidoglycan/LPS O-acetylase OafA/YrhL
MVVLGMIIGAICFYFQDSAMWPSIHQVPVWKMLLILVIGSTLLPVPISMDIRGWQEMHPLNGPGWSLFFEYIANLLYAVWVRKFSKIALGALVLLAACALIHLAVSSPAGDIIGGWSLDPQQLRIGFTRVMYPFFAGLLLARTSRLRQVRYAFLWSGLLLLVFLVMPRVGGSGHLWLNGLYDSLTVIIIFPFVVFVGASASPGGKAQAAVCKLLGDISYPLYITHYPFIYMYTAWVSDHKPGFTEALPFALLTFAASLVVAYASLKWFDEPVRKWLKKKMLERPAGSR